MDQGRVSNPTKTILRSLLIIVWWVCIWELVNYAIHYLSSKSLFQKPIIYIGLIAIILGTVGLDPHVLDHM